MKVGDGSRLRQRALKLVSQKGMISASEATAAGIPSVVLTRLVESGHLVRISRGIYRLAEAPVSEHSSLMEVAKQNPSAVIVLLSALAYHQIGTQLPSRVWILLPHGSRPSRAAWPKVRVVRSRLEQPFEDGVEVHRLGATETGGGVEVRVTSPARTVADCFKYRRQVGMEVCYEALKSVLQDRTAMAKDILHFARMNRVEKIVRPALEAIL